MILSHSLLNLTDFFIPLISFLSYISSLSYFDDLFEFEKLLSSHYAPHNDFLFCILNFTNFKRKFLLYYYSESGIKGFRANSSRFANRRINNISSEYITQEP